MKKFFTMDRTYSEMTRKYTLIDGILAIGLYILLNTEFAVSGYLQFTSGIRLGIWPGLLEILIVIVLVICRRQKLSTVGITKRNFLKSLSIGLILGIICFLVGAIPQFVAGKTLKQTPEIIYKIFYYLIIIGFNEEITYRGYIGTRIYAFFKSDTVAVIVVSVMFSLSHIPYQMTYRGIGIVEFLAEYWWMLVLPFIGSFVLNFLFRKYNSIVAPAVFHLFMDIGSDIFL